MPVIKPEDDPVVEWVHRRVQLCVAEYVNASPRPPSWSVGKLEFACIRNGYYNMKYDFDPERPAYTRGGRSTYGNFFVGRLVHENIKILPIQEMHIVVKDDAGRDLMFGHLDEVYYDGSILIDKKTLMDVKSYTASQLPRTIHCRQINYYRGLLKYGFAAEDIKDVYGFVIVEKGAKVNWDVKRELLVYIPAGDLLSIMVAEPDRSWTDIPTRECLREVLRKRDAIEVCLSAGTPTRPSTSWECAYCSWYDICINEDEPGNYNLPEDTVTHLQSLPAL